MEAQCETLVRARCKQAGMRWHSRTLESLLRIRCAVWDERYNGDCGHWPGNFTA